MDENKKYLTALRLGKLKRVFHYFVTPISAVCICTTFIVIYRHDGFDLTLVNNKTWYSIAVGW